MLKMQSMLVMATIMMGTDLELSFLKAKSVVLVVSLKMDAKDHVVDRLVDRIIA